MPIYFTQPSSLWFSSIPIYIMLLQLARIFFSFQALLREPNNICKKKRLIRYVVIKSQNMCHPGGALISLRDLAVHRRWYAMRAHMVVERVEESAGGSGGSGSGGGGSVKQCLCSPTRHPGSFRCRKHHAEYVWGGGIAKNRSANQAAKKRKKKTCMKCKCTKTRK